MTTTKPQSPSTTFAVDNVTPAAAPLLEIKMHDAVRQLLQSEIESCSDYHSSVVGEVHYHGLLAAVYLAFSQHRPLVLTPDAIWITITQGIAHHMTLHAETLRPRFVAHQGRLELVVDISDFIKGSPENPWDRVFAGWSNQIRDHVGQPLHSALIADFSTTTTLARTVSEITIMDIFERYFHYEARGICGIPQITLEGSLSDWQKLRAKIACLEKFDLGWWLHFLRPICDQFIRAAQNDIDLPHWQSICKLREAYGGDIINGWIAHLFPYLREFIDGPCRRKNPIFETGDGFQSLVAPSGLSQVPFTWRFKIPNTPLTEIDMEAIAGFTGITQDPETNALRPKLGWAVREVGSLKAALNRLRREHQMHPTQPLSTHLHDRRDPCNLFIPADLAEFYSQTNGAELFTQFPTPKFQILPSSHLARVRPDPRDNHPEVRFADSPGWHRFCLLDDNSFLAIDLGYHMRPKAGYEDAARKHQELNRKYSTAKNFSVRQMDAERAALPPVVEDFANWIILCHPNTLPQPRHALIVADSFEEFLTRALASNGTYWWTSPTFPQRNALELESL